MLHELKQKLREFFQKAVKFTLLSTILFISICLLSERNPIDIFVKQTVRSGSNNLRSDSLISISILLPCFYLTAYFLPKALAIGGMILLGIFLNSPLTDEFFLVDSETSAFFQKLAYILIIFRSGFSIEVKNLVRMRFSLFSIIVLLVIGEMMLICLFSVYILDYNWSIGLTLGSLLSGASPLVVNEWTQRITEDANEESFPDSLKDKLPEILETLRSVLIVGGALSEMISICTFMNTLRFVFAKEDCFYTILIPLPFEIFFGFLAGLFGGFLIPYCSKQHRYFDYLKTEDEDRISSLKSSILLTVLILTGSFSLLISGEMIGCFVFGPIAVFFFGFFSRITMKKKRKHIYVRVKTQLSLLCTFFLVPLLFGLLGFHLSFEMVNGMFGESRLLELIILFAIILFIKSIIILFARRPIVGTRKLLCIFLLLPKATPQALLGAVFLDRALRENRFDLEEVGHVFLIASILSIVLLSPAGMLKVKSLKDKKFAYEKSLLHYKNFGSIKNSDSNDSHYEGTDDEMRLGCILSSENPFQRLTLPRFLWKEDLKKWPKFDPTLYDSTIIREYDKYDNQREKSRNLVDLHSKRSTNYPYAENEMHSSVSEDPYEKFTLPRFLWKEDFKKWPKFDTTLIMDSFTSESYSVTEVDEQEQSTSQIESRNLVDLSFKFASSLADYQYAKSKLLTPIKEPIQRKVTFDQNAQVIPEEDKVFVQKPPKLSALKRIRRMAFGKSKARPTDSTSELNQMAESTSSTIIGPLESRVSSFDQDRESKL